MENNYSWSLDLNYIAHYGVAADENPPGRGSGRYPKGSGAKNGFRKITDAAVRLKKFFQKDRVNKPKEDEKLDEDELFGLVKKSLTDEFSDTEKGRMYDLLQKKYGKVTSMSDLDIEFQNARHDLAEREKSRKMGEMSNKIQDEKTRGDSDSESKTISEQPRQETKQDHEAARKAALASGDRNEIMKYFNESSADEIQKAIEKAGLKDQLSKSINDAYKASHPEPEKPKSAEQERADYVKQELWSGDLNRILKVASDKSITVSDLETAIRKAETYDNLNRKVNPTAGEKIFNAVDKGMQTYNKIASIYNMGASINNQINKDLKLPTLPTQQKPISNQNQNNNQQKQAQQNQQKQNNNQQQNSQPAQNQPKPQQPQQPQQPQNNNQQQAQPKQQNSPQQTQQATPKQQQASQQVVNWLNTDVLTSPRSEKFYQSTIATLNQPIKSSSNKPIEFTPSNNAYNNTSSVKWMQMTIDPSILNKKL